MNLTKQPGLEESAGSVYYNPQSENRIEIPSETIVSTGKSRKQIWQWCKPVGLFLFCVIGYIIGSVLGILLVRGIRALFADAEPSVQMECGIPHSSSYEMRLETVVKASSIRTAIFVCREAGGVSTMLPEVVKCPLTITGRKDIRVFAKDLHTRLKKEMVTLGDMGLKPTYKIKHDYSSLRLNDVGVAPLAYTVNVTVTTYGTFGPVYSGELDTAKDAADIEALTGIALRRSCE